MRVNPANLRDFPGRSGVPTEIAHRGVCQLTQPNLEDLQFLDIHKSFRISYPLIRVPPNGASSARMRCAMPRDVSIVQLQSHMHRRGVGFVADVVREGGAAERVYENDAWEGVPSGRFAPPLELRAGDALDFRCDYVNPEAREVAQGLTTRDEMCTLIGPYYPRDPRVDVCMDDQGFPAETWIGSGTATCAETMSCFTAALPTIAEGFGPLSACVVESCPGAAEQVSAFVRCALTQGRGACAAARAAPSAECDACMSIACAADIDPCQAAACD